MELVSNASVVASQLDKNKIDELKNESSVNSQSVLSVTMPPKFKDGKTLFNNFSQTQRTKFFINLE